MSLADVADLLVCPTCPAESASELELRERALRCTRGHTFDIARQGYVNLLGGPPPRHADTPAMVAARDRVLSGPTYAPVIAGVAEAAREALSRRDEGGPPPALVDCGAGTGHYLAACLGGERARGVALDVSVPAARRAARWPRPLGVVVADAWQRWPLRTAAAALVLSVFAPRHVAEFARVLGPQGAVVTAHPTSDHLDELRTRLGLLGQQPDKDERLVAGFAPVLQPVARRRVRTRDHWDRETIRDVVAMGPNAFHRHGMDEQALPPRLPVTVSVEITTWRRA